MQETIVSNIYCNKCGTKIVLNEKDGERVPCPTCGSVSRNYKDTVVGRMVMTGGQ